MFGKITYWNQPKGFGFLTETIQKSPLEALSQQQFFFHHSNFTKFAAGRKVQAVGVRFATAAEIAAAMDRSKTEAGVNALGVAQESKADAGVK